MQRFGLLGGVGMIWSGVHLQLAQLSPAETIVRQHSANGAPDGVGWAAGQQVTVLLAVQTAGVTRMAVHELLRRLVAGQHDLFGVHDHDVVAAVDVRGEGRLVLAAQNSGHLGGHPAEHHAFGINDEPSALDLRCFGGVGAHAGAPLGVADETSGGYRRSASWAASPTWKCWTSATTTCGGEIPAELGSLSYLTDLALTGNELSGEIPAELGSLANLERLNLSSNWLSGEIPAELGSLANLESLVLDDSGLSGEIPPELGSLSYLELLNLSQNQLSGCAPASLRRDGLRVYLLQLDMTLYDIGDLPFC